MGTFHFQLLFQVATERSLTHCAANDNSLSKLTQLNSSDACAVKKKSTEDKIAFQENGP